ncbi:MAG: hypothetical protein KDD66_02085 [Bdellovibrionales bacterium]|nr:hypothetical protein [Bdellovibrionales bacterium]
MKVRLFLLMLVVLTRVMQDCAHAQTYEQSVFDRARRVVDITKKLRYDQEDGSPAPVKQNSSEVRSMLKPQTEDSRRFFFDEPRTTRKSANVPSSCARPRRRQFRSDNVSSVFNNADYIFYSSSDNTQTAIASKFHQLAVAYPTAAHLEPKSLADIDLRQKLAQEIELRCLPARVVVRKSGRSSSVQIYEGSLAWPNQDNLYRD